MGRVEPWCTTCHFSLNKCSQTAFEYRADVQSIEFRNAALECLLSPKPAAQRASVSDWKRPEAAGQLPRLTSFADRITATNNPTVTTKNRIKLVHDRGMIPGINRPKNKNGKPPAMPASILLTRVSRTNFSPVSGDATEPRNVSRNSPPNDKFFASITCSDGSCTDLLPFVERPLGVRTHHFCSQALPDTKLFPVAAK